jgi:hypothetical protein
MAVYQRGSKGEEVEKIQSKLKDFDYYLGPIDGIFGGGTEAAVKKFQTDKDLLVDGKVGKQTWAALFDDEEIGEPSIIEKGLDYRCLALTGSFETGKPVPECFSGLTGDFDDQGISFGALQWNFGQRSLQPLLKEMNEEHQKILKDIFHTEYEILVQILESDYEEQMEWARSIQDPVRHFIYEPWRGLFKALGRTKDYQEIQVRYTKEYYRLAQSWLESYGLWSERAEALLFDIRVQNGSIQSYVKAQILRDFEELGQGLDKNDEEIAKLRIIANRRAEASNPRWVEDVRRRKLCIANGEGVVHGNHYHLESQYGIQLNEAA